MRLRTSKEMARMAVERLLKDVPNKYDLHKGRKSPPYDPNVELLIKALPKLNAAEIRALEVLLRDALRATRKDAGTAA